MKKNIKKILALVLALTLVLALAACGGNDNSNSNSGGDSGSGSQSSDNQSSGGDSSGGSSTASFKKATIGVGLYSDTGPAPDSTKAFLASLEDALNVKFIYTLLSQTDEATNVTKIQELIASGADGIICTMDMGMDAILKECSDAGVPLAGYLCDYDTSYTTNFDNIFGNKYFLGTVADGPCGDDLKRGYDFFDSLIEYNDRTPDAPIRHVAMTTFPFWAFPYQALFVEQFVGKVEEYNAANPDKAIEVDPFDESTDILMFSPVDSTYFTKHAGIDAVISFCAGEFVYGTMVSAGLDSTMKLFAAGYTEGDNTNFGSKGNGTYQLELVCAPESIVYPVVLLINEINGVSFPDQPEVAERRSCTSFIINSDEDMELFERSVYLTNDVQYALLSAQDVVNLTAVANPSATYADLVAVLDHMNIEDLK